MTYLMLPEGEHPRLLPFYFAVEEYIARHYDDDDYFFIWQVPPTVMLGRNQVIESEVNLDYCRQQGVHVFRRKSGGGCVYTDGGCLQFSYITKTPSVNGAFTDYMERVVRFLRAIGIPAECSGRNDILVEGRKVAGNAFYRVPGRSILHNTLLYTTNLEEMLRCLTPSDDKLISKGVESVRQRVTNIKDYTTLTISQLIEAARTHICGDKVRLFTEADMKGILPYENYLASPDFILGSNPKYTVIRTAHFDAVGNIEARVEVHKSRIKTLNLVGDYFLLGDMDTELLRPLQGVTFERNAVAAALCDVHLGEIIRGLTIEHFLRLLFGKIAHVKKPAWLKVSIASPPTSVRTGRIIQNHRLHTICSSGRCPNRAECWAAGTATFMIGGNVCTRCCRFCNTATGKPQPLDADEPQRVAESVHLLQLKYAVLTSVDRDDLPDYGAAHWAATIRAVREKNPDTVIEVLIPDFMGDTNCLDTVLAEHPNVVGHNIETIRRLTPVVRSVARYERSLEVLRYIAQSGFTCKTGLMVGLGETEAEVVATMRDLAEVGVSILTIGQYLQPTYNHIPVAEYITPEQFQRYRQLGEAAGIRHVISGPLVRSSYHAAATYAQEKDETRP